MKKNLIVTKTVNAISVDGSKFYYEGDTVDIKIRRKKYTDLNIRHIGFNAITHNYEMTVASSDRVFTINPQTDISSINLTTGKKMLA